MVLLKENYAVIGLNIPHVDGSKKQICEAFHDKMFNFGWNTKKKPKYMPLFQKYTIKETNGTRDPISDPKRFHCENLLSVLKYRPLKSLPKIPKALPSSMNQQLQYIIEASTDIAKMVGGGDMKLIYSSLLVSKPGGEKQSWHQDVNEAHAPNCTVLAMIISLQCGTTVDIQLNGISIPIHIPPGFVMVFDAKSLIHRGVGYKKWNSRIYLKFGTHPLLETSSGASEVTPLTTCFGCKADISTNFKNHSDVCIPFWVKVKKMTEARATKLVNINIENNKKKYKKYNNGKRKLNALKQAGGKPNTNTERKTKNKDSKN